MKEIENKKFQKDLFWYLLGSIIPSLLSFIRNPIFTRIFTPEEYGYYSIVVHTFSYLSIILFSWIGSCLWRYYFEYQKKNELKILYSNIITLLLVSSIVVLVIMGFWLSQTDNILIRKLVILSTLYQLTYNFIYLYLIIIRLQEKAFQFNLYYSIQAAGAFGILCLFVFILEYRIESILIGQVSINILLLLFLTVRIRKIPGLSSRHLSFSIIKELLRYGAVGLILGFGVMALNTSDRYIIALYAGMGAVGIYNQIYMLSQYSIYHLITVYFNTINPKLNKILVYNSEDKESKIKEFVGLFLMLILPLTVYFSLFSKELSIILLGEKFRIGYRMIPYIMFSSFIYGLTLFNETKLKFENRFRPLITGIIAALVLNIVLNFILIPLFNYQWAAYTTLASYIILFLIFYWADSLKFITTRFFTRKIRLAIIIIISQVIIDLIIRKVLKIEISVVLTVIEGMVFLLIYTLIMKLNKRTIAVTLH
ncbi:MAG: oligosaccharide flippase family protein [Bacteroidales bacterium]|nr:MAG: oligosaccharide flippase family protein [Bacteroidales bacterium]